MGSEMCIRDRLLTGAAGLRRAYHDSERLGARGSAWPCVSALRRPGRRPVYSARFITDWRRGGPRVSCQGILGWVNGFATLSQASGASQRVQRASAACSSNGACGGWPCTPRSFVWPQPGGRPSSAQLSCDCDFPFHEGSPLCNWVCALVGALIIPDAVRRTGPTGASGKEWTLFAPRCAVSLSIERERRAAGGARASHLVRRVCDPNPINHCARTCCSPARRRGSPRFGCLSF